MDPNQSGYYQLPPTGNPYQYPQQQQQPQPQPQPQPPHYSSPQQMAQYTNGSHGRNGYAPVLQPINTHQGMYSQTDSLRSSSTSSSYHQQSSVPISPNTFGNYPQNPGFQPPREQPTVPQLPPSPSQSESQEEEEYRSRIPGPPPEMHEFEGKKYGLKVAQEPIRARMCGFGDKDRRPITTPPIVQAVIFDAKTGKELDYQNCEFELSHFVVQVHIFDEEGRIEKSIVKTAPGQQIISATLASGYPSTPVPSSPSRTVSRLPLDDAVYGSTHGRHPSLNGQFAQPYSSSPYAYGATTAAGAMFPTAVPPPPTYGQIAGNAFPTYGGYPRNGSSAYPSGNVMISTGPSQPPTPPPTKNEEAGPGYSRNLIGANTMSGQLLQDHHDQWGIFFAFTDLSVRSEDWFRLKFSLFNVGESVSGLSNEQLLRMAEENNSAPSTMSSSESGNRAHKRLEGLKAGLIAKTAPCLATVYSQAFKVYSAKKFPGVADGTEISRRFAKQGVKISVRKESKTGDKRKRGGDDGDDDGDDFYDENE